MRKTILTLAAAALCTMLAACSVFAPQRGFNRAMVDRNVQLTAQHALNDDPELKGRAHIAANVYNGVLLLIGEASTEAVKQRAQADVTGYDGVQRVVNLIDVMPLPSVADTMRDAALTAQVKAALLRVDLPGFDAPGRVTVSSSHGKVYLMGIVSHQEADAVVAVARKVTGVQQVVQVFEYMEDGRP
ncbi:MAG: BON domain-containing protein [Rhodanobacteraceae bacterium]